jgi:hypothetical protein
LENGALFTPAYTHYTPAQRAAIRAAYTSRGYTHFPIGIFTERRRSYHDAFPPGPKDGNVSPYLEELWADGIYPVCFVLQDRETAADAERNAARLTDRDLCRIVVPKWEMNDPDANDTARMNAEILATRAAFPNAQLYVHFTARRTAGGSPEDAWWGDGWRKGSTGHADDWPGASRVGVRGLLYQDDRWNDPDAVIDRLGDVLVQLAGFDVVLFETENPARAHAEGSVLQRLLWAADRLYQRRLNPPMTRLISCARAIVAPTARRRCATRDRSRAWETRVLVLRGRAPQGQARAR